MQTQDNLLSSYRVLAVVSSLSPNWHRLLVVLTALVLSLPCLISGIPGDGDGITHAQYQRHFSEQFWTGDLYPRWLMNSNKGYGSPIFLLQYPLPYWITALIRPLVRFRPGPTQATRELGVFCFLALAAAGLAARFWFRKRFGPLAATAAAIVYIALPFIVAFELYKSSAIGQLSAAIWMPLVLASCDSLRLSLRSVGTLGVVIALLVMSNLITAVLFLPLMVGYAIASRESGRISLSRSIVAVFVSLSIGFGIAAVYLLPLIVYRPMFDLSVWAYLVPSYFAFVRGTSVSVPLVAAALSSAAIVTGVAAYGIWTARRGLAWRISMLLPLGAGALMAAPGLGQSLIRASGMTLSFVYGGRVYHPEKMLAIALSMLALAVLAYCVVPKESVVWQDHALLIAVCASFILMLPWSAFLWKAMPTLATAIQFPHRFGGILVLAVAGLFAAALDSSLRFQPRREGMRCLAIVTSVALAVIVAGFFTWQADGKWKYGLRSRASYAFDETQDVDWMYTTYVSPDRVSSVAKLLGTSPGSDRAERTLPGEGDAELVQGRGSVEAISRKPRNVVVSLLISETSVMRMAQLYSPLWKVVLSDQKSGNLNLRSSDDGLVEVSLGPGQHNVELTFDRGWPERYGLIVTALSLLIVATGLAWDLYSNDRAKKGWAVFHWRNERVISTAMPLN
jgi:hypothetical protein